MVLQLKRIFERIGDQMDISAVIPLEELREMGTSIDYASPISLSGRINNLAGMVSLDYSLRATVRHLCDRCLDEFDREYSLSFSHILVRDESSLNGEDDVYCEGLALDMNELAISDLLVNLPTKVLCREDCLGLCPDCGKNLNDGDCDCDYSED